MRRVPPAAQAALVLAALVAIFLGRPILHGQWYLPSDLTQLAGTRTDPPGAPVEVQNSLQSDPVTQMDPWLHYDRQEVHAGRLPTWNPYNGLGVPQLANYQSAVFSPYTLPFYVLPLRWAFTVSAGLKLWTLAFFTYLFLRRWRLRHGGALLGAIIYGFGGYHLLWLNWQHVGAAICLPAGAWATMVVVQAETTRVRRLGFASVALAVGAGVVAGHPETLLWSAVALAIVIAGTLLSVPAPWRRRATDAVGIGLAGLLGVALGAVQLLPFAQYLKLSTQYATRTGIGSVGGTNLVSAPLLAFPDTLGNPSLAYHEPTYLIANYNEINGDYVGLIAMGLAILGLCALFRRSEHRRFAFISTIVTAVGWALFHVHAVSAFVTRTAVLKLSTVNRSHDVWIFGVALLAAVGTDLAIGFFTAEATGVGEARLRRRLLWAGGVLVVAAGGVALSLKGYANLRHLQRTVAGNIADTAVAIKTVHTHVEWVLGCTVVAVLAVALLLLAPGPLRRVTGVALPVLIALVALAQFGITGAMLRTYNPSLPASQVYPLTPAYQSAIDLTGNDTSIKDQTTFALPDTNLWWRTPQLTSYDALGVRWYDTLYAKVFGGPTSAFFDEGTPSCMESLRLFGVSWVWSTKAHVFTPGDPGVGTTNVVGPDVTGLALARVIGKIRLFKVPQSSGRFVVVPNTVAASDDTAALAQVSSCSFDPDATAVVLRQGEGSTIAAPVAVAGSAHQQVTPVIDQPEHLRLTVSGGNGGELVLRQTWFPGWQATVDGHPTPIDRVDVAFRGVALGAGSHVVDMVYKPVQVREGVVISGLASLATGVLASPFTVSLPRRRRRRAGGVPDGEKPGGSPDSLDP